MMERTPTQRDGHAGDGAPGAPDSPRIAVVIPAYRQPQYLPDAVLSATRQTIADQVRTVIVNDGCPLERTDWTGRFFAEAFPDRVAYLKLPNGGVERARNTGIRHALERWPTIEAVFPLDADNRLSSMSLERLWRALEGEDATVGWAFQDITRFGTAEYVERRDVPFCAYRIMHENYCDTGSLVRRAVYESGIWFDEKLRSIQSGYEDWEFYLHASLRGFRGIHVAGTDFLYRTHGHSLVADAQRKHLDIVRYFHRKHASAYAPNAIAAREHSELPRFALVLPDLDAAHYFTNPLDTPSQTGTLGDFVRDVRTYAGESRPQKTYLPPVVVFAHSQAIALLRARGVLPGLLWTVQERLHSGAVTATISIADSPFALDLDAPRGEGDPFLVAMTARAVVAATRGIPVPTPMTGEAAHDVHVSVGIAHYTGAPTPLLQAIAAHRLGLPEDVRHCWEAFGMPRSVSPRPIADRDPDFRMSSHTEFALTMQLDARDGHFPYYPPRVSGERPLDVFFVVPWLKLGGVDQCILRLTTALRANSTRYRFRLVITNSPSMEVAPASLSPFDTVAWIPSGGDTQARRAMLARLLAGADVIVNANSAPGYEVLAELRAHRRIPTFSYLHSHAIGAEGVPFGYPFMAAREYEQLIDGFIVISEPLGRLCEHLGVPAEKIHLVPNAPTVHPPTIAAALAIAERKARSYSPTRPLHLLAVGRFDHEKGMDRVARVAADLEEHHLPCDVRIVGKPVFPGTPMVAPNVAISPAVFRPEALAAYYTDADAILLLSRSEGVPLVLMEGMAFGNIAIATDVGAVSSLVIDGETGILIDAQQEEAAIVAAVRRAVKTLIAHPDAFAEMRSAATRRAMGYTWECAARRFSTAIESVVAR